MEPIEYGRIVGVDPSLTGTGVAVADRTCTIASQPGGDTPAGRLARLEAIADQVVHMCPPGLNQAVVEAPSLGQHRQAGTLDRNGLWWLLIQQFTRIGATVVDVPPATVKKFATGNGSAAKPDLRMALYRRAGLDLPDDNQVDAFWLYQIGLHLAGHPDAIPVPQTHRSALNKLSLAEPVAAA